MPRTLSQAETLHKSQVESEDPLVWLYEVQARADPQTMYRLTNYDEALTYRGNVYERAPIVHGGIRQNGMGDLPTFDFALGNSTLQVSPIVDAADGFMGSYARITLIDRSLVGNPDAGQSFDGEIVACSMSDQDGVQFSVASRSMVAASLPRFRFSRRRCRFLLGDGGCGYDLIATGAVFTTCPGYTFEACELVGADELARGLEVKHPKRFGGHPGIPKIRGVA